MSVVVGGAYHRLSGNMRYLSKGDHSIDQSHFVIDGDLIPKPDDLLFHFDHQRFNGLYQFVH
jgi:hypothetical protein